VADVRAAAALAGPPGVRPLSDVEFARFRELIRREAGIHLSDAKQPLLVGRLSRRLRELGLRSFGDYYHLAVEDAAERTRLIDAICTHETRFFREPAQFEYLDRVVLPRWRAEADAGRRPRRVRVWSAACSSGEEPYSLAMLLRAHCPADRGWYVEIVASDLSTRILAHARAAEYRAERLGDIPEAYRRRFVATAPSGDPDRFVIAPVARDVVRFERLNLTAPDLPLAGRFDLVFCRNVLIYFEAETKAAVALRVFDRVAPGGYLFLGHAESLNGLVEHSRPVIPTVYPRAA
jgi:chemotaxis protein methyltransferase CheR